jgi:CSLREA domain-containing protein
MKIPERIFDARWSAFSRRLEQILSRTLASCLGASRAIARPGLLVALLVVLAPICLVLSQSKLHAGGNTMTVNNLTDPASTSGNGFCTLREAIDNANAASDTSGGDCAAGTGTDTINFSVSGKITLTSTLPAIANSSPGSLTIDGTGQTITIDGDDSFQVLQVNSGATLSLNSLTIANGNQGAGDGGAIYNSGTSLTITNCTFSGNSSNDDGGTFGGAIFSSGGSVLTVDRSVFSSNSAGANGSGGAIAVLTGPISITNSVFSDNQASIGGGIFQVDAENTLTVGNSTFSNNSALSDGTANGGAIDCLSGTITNSNFIRNSATTNGGGVNCTNAAISGSTFSGNVARFGGGIIDGGDGLITVTNSTFSGNSGSGPDNAGGGIYVENSTLTVTNSTFSGDSAGAGGSIYNNASIVTITNSVLAGSSGGNCAAVDETITNGGYNISDDATCGFGTSTGANGKTIGDSVNPLLAPAGLQNNGGPTQTIALQAGSPAIAAVPLAQCTVTTDQRGDPRPGVGYNACDVGAYEFAAIVVNTLSDSSPSSDHLCSLREAINNTNSPGTDTTGGDCATGIGSDVIKFSVSGTITLGSRLPGMGSIDSVTIDGSGQTITIDGANSFQVLGVSSGGAPITLQNLTIAHGNTLPAAIGGGILNGGNLTISNCTLSNNSAISGGAIYNEEAATLTVTNSTFSGNFADQGPANTGAGIENFDGTVTIADSTFSGNSGANGGGIDTESGSTTTIFGSVFSDNSGGNCSVLGGVGIADGGYNISDDDSCGFGSSIAANGDAIGDGVSDAHVTLDPSGLANNGGPTETIALESGSFAIDAIPLADCPATDQRGAPRPAPAQTDCDIGAFEFGGVVPSSPIPPTSVSVTGTLAFVNVPVGQTAIKTVRVTNTGKTNPLVISGSMPSDSEYALNASGTCGSIPITVAPKKSCTLGIAFTPNALGAHPATLAIIDNSSTSPQHITLTGTGTPDLTTTKSSLVFGDVKFGLKGIEAFAVVNHQSQSVTLSESFSGANFADFTVSGGTCTTITNLGSLKACSIIVSFSPSVLGTESATLSVSDSPDPLSPHLITLSTGPTIPETITPVTLAYGTLTAKVSTKTKDVTITNKSGSSLSVGESFSGANASDFAVTGGTCAGTAPANSSCTIAVTFTPTGGGSAESASMAVTIGSDPSSPHNISLTGKGP